LHILLEMSQDAIFKALAHKGRRMLLDKLHKANGLTLMELCETLPMSRQAVSKHLRILEKANLVGIKWRGREKLHFLNSAPIRAIYGRWMRKYQAHYSRELEKLKINLESNNKKKEK
jgi:DNA-binding transcriptional ArsR family regulator